MTKTQIVLVMHGNLGQGMFEAASRFNRDAEKCVSVLGLADDMSLNQLKSEFEKIIRANDNQILVMTDILAGSCTVAITQMMREYDFPLITGTNLSMLLAAIENSTALETSDLESVGKDDIRLINRKVVGK